MDKIQEDMLSMFMATSDVLENNASIYSGNVPFTDAVGRLTDGIGVIDELHDQQEEDTTGVTQDKENRRTKLEDETYRTGSIIAFYASVAGNRTLLEKVNFTKTNLSKCRDNELPGMSTQVHQAAVANAVAILPCGVTATMTTDLAAAIADFTEYISKPRAAKTETSSATAQMPKAFDDVTVLLEEQLDRGMELYSSTEPDFYNSYINARIVINSPTLKRALEVTFVDSVTNKPIMHVRAVVDGSIYRRSSTKGNIRVQSLTEGGHTITGTIPGYNPISQDFNVISGETTKLILQMIKV